MEIELIPVVPELFSVGSVGRELIQEPLLGRRRPVTIWEQDAQSVFDTEIPPGRSLREVLNTYAGESSDVQKVLIRSYLGGLIHAPHYHLLVDVFKDPFEVYPIEYEEELRSIIATTLKPLVTIGTITDIRRYKVINSIYGLKNGIPQEDSAIIMSEMDIRPTVLKSDISSVRALLRRDSVVRGMRMFRTGSLPRDYLGVALMRQIKTNPNVQLPIPVFIKQDLGMPIYLKLQNKAGLQKLTFDDL